MQEGSFSVSRRRIEGTPPRPPTTATVARVSHAKVAASWRKLRPIKSSMKSCT
jgi:hypothetical protein